MTSLCSRSILRIIRRPFYTSTCKFEKVKNPKTYGAFDFEQEGLASGNDDVFDVKPKPFGPGGKECPNIVESYFNSRIVGCACNSEQYHYNWMWVHAGPPRRCECGYWFKLVKKAPKK